MNQRIIDDHARAIGKALLDVVGPAFREEEHRDLWDALIEVCKAGLETYEMCARRHERRMKPGTN